MHDPEKETGKIQKSKNAELEKIENIQCLKSGI